MAQRIGIIGVGNMGSAIGHRLLDLDFPLLVRDLRVEAERPLAERGARIVASPAELVRQVDATLIVVVDAAQIDNVLFNEGCAAETALRPGTVVLLLSTIAPADSTRIAARLAQRGVQVLDAPISGGPARARDGTMTMMLAGADAAIDMAQPLLTAICGRAIPVGRAPGQAAAMKLVNNLLAGVHLAAAAEALAIGQRAGLDLGTMLAVIGASSGASWMLTDRGARVLAGDEQPRAHLSILAKDMTLALALAEQCGCPALVGQAADRHFAQALVAGLAGADDSALLQQALTDTQARIR